MDLRTEEINKLLHERIESFDEMSAVYASGRVASISDGVVKVDRLPGRCNGELLRFGKNTWGIAMDLDEDGVGAVLLTHDASVSVGDPVGGTGHPVDVPVSDEVIGRIISPLGLPLDGRPLKAKKYAPMEKPAPSINMRRPVDTPMETGILAIDSMIPIGRGQRELINGDRQTGKTAIAIDTIINQRGKNVICVYCAIGQKASTIAKVAQQLRSCGAMDYTVVVAATASDMPAMQYLAPYAACSVAEEFMSGGRDVLVVYDDLSKHAVAYRTMSLLLHRPPGREAYPGDVFYLHSRLLERSACLSEAMGGGSITALPIIETVGGNISSYIPTNVISITDGQIFLETELFHAGIMPAINPGISVSRVGGSAQLKSMKKVSGELKLLYSQYRELQSFAQFGSDLDADTKARLALGERIVEVLKQGRNAPVRVGCQVAIIYAVTKGFLNNIPVSRVSDYETALYTKLTTDAKELLARLEEGYFEKSDEEALIKLLGEIKIKR